MSELLVPITEAAHRLGVGRTKTYELLDAGDIEAVTIGRRRLVVAESVAAYVDRLRGRPADAAGRVTSTTSAHDARPRHAAPEQPGAHDQRTRVE